MSDIVLNEGLDNVDLNCESRIMKNYFTKNLIVNKKLLMSNFYEVFSGIKNIKKIIRPEKIYIAKFPKDVLEKIHNGQYDLMKSKDGEILSTVIDKLAPGNKNIVHQLRLKKVKQSIGENVKNLSSNLTNIVLQQQLAELSESLSNIQILVVDIKRGQVTDRIGFVNAGRKQLEQGLAIDVTLPHKKQEQNQLIHNGIQSLNIGKEQLTLFIKDELKKCVRIPQNRFQLALMFLFKSKNYEEMEKQFGMLQECLEAYISATTLLASAYQLLGNNEVLPGILSDAKEMINISYKKMCELSKIVLQGSSSDTYWFFQPQILLDDISSIDKITMPEEVTIEFTGDEIFKEKLDE